MMIKLSIQISTILLLGLMLSGCGNNAPQEIEAVIISGPDGGGSGSMIVAPVVVEAKVTHGGDGDKYYYYHIAVVRVIKNAISVELGSSVKVARVNYLPQPKLNKIYILDLDHYNEAHPEYGLKMVSFKEK